MLQMINILFSPIALIALGFYLFQSRTLDEKFWNGAEKLNYYVLFPSLLFSSLASANMHMGHLDSILMVIFAMMAIIIVSTYIFAKLNKSPDAHFGVYIQSLIRFNTYIGLSIATTLSNPEIKSILVNILAIAIPFVNVVSILSLTPKNQLNIKNIAISLIKNPLINSCILGIAFNLLQIPIWTGFQSLLQAFSSSSLMLGLLCVGTAIQFKGMQAYFKTAFIISLARLCIIPIATFIVLQFFELSYTAVVAIMIFFSIPTASASYILTKLLNGDYQLMAAVISLQTILSVFTLAIMLALVQSYYF
ncbi:AEC family transporter [Acinetobacter wuhouensis]|uniref:AEC family transporter n=1 Tax=Acinetobacter wuhouensis TaxID=1879050 RepID=A0A4Q7AHY1_9GAMM|nr:AEC family transporter [Acinetobacter wuhouensis]RZG47054.1 AEC family transporter [Acinetobacter wuhouensis]RZG70029.1 AEC family transporter [Acinetobacter wuhouensis]